MKIYNILLNLLIVFFCVSFWSIIEHISPLFYTYDDNVPYFAQLVFNWRSVIENGSIPFINFHQFLGENYIGQGQMGVFSPFTYGAVFLSLLFFDTQIWSIDCLILIYQILAALGMYWFLVQNGIRKLLAVLISLLYITLPFCVIVSKSWYQISYIAAFLPWNLFFLFKLLKNKNIKNAFILALLKAFCFYSGHPQFVFILCYTEFLFLIFYILFKYLDFNKIDFKKHYSLKNLNEIIKDYSLYFVFSQQKKFVFNFLKYYIFSIFTFVLISFPKILSTIHLMSNAFIRDGKLNSEDVLSGSIEIKKFIAAQFFKNSNIIFNAGYEIFFIGAPFLLCVYLIFKKKVLLASSKNLIFLFVSIFTFLFGTSFYGILALFPLFNLFRWPFKHFIFFLFFFSILIAFLVENYLTIIKSKNKKWGIMGTLLFLICFNIGYSIQKGHNEKNSFANYHIYSDLKEPDFKFINKTKGRIFVIGSADTFEEKITDTNYYNYLLSLFPTVWEYYGFSGYSAFLNKINLTLSLGDLYHIKKYQRMNILSLYDFSDYIDFFSYWSGRYLITYRDLSIQKKIDQYPQIKKIYEDKEKLVYKNKKALPLIYLESNPQKFIDFEIKVNTIKIKPKNKKKDMIVMNFAPIEGYQYRFSKKESFQELKVPKIELDKKLWQKEVCEFEGKKLNPCIILSDDKEKMKVRLKIEPLKIKIPANTNYLEVRYRDKYFFYGVYVLISYLTFLVLGRIIWKFRKIKK